MDTLSLVILFVMAFLPPIFYAIWIRNTEKYDREKWIPIIICFLWGATIAVIASLIIEIFLGSIAFFSINEPGTLLLVSLVLIAPFAEELTKPLVMRFNIVKKELVEPEDGLIYGAVAGLGFSATENLFYGYDAFISEGVLFFLILITIRSFAGCLLHASATAWTGYGYGKFIMKKSKFVKVLPYFALAIIVHGLYNFLPAFGMITGISLGALSAFIFVSITIYIVRKKIMTLDGIGH